MVGKTWDEGMSVVQMKMHGLAEPADRTRDVEHVPHGTSYRILDVCH